MCHCVIEAARPPLPPFSDTHGSSTFEAYGSPKKEAGEGVTSAQRRQSFRIKGRSERAPPLSAAPWGRMSNHWEPSTRHPRPAARPQRASWTQDHSGLSLVLTLVWERRCPRWRKTRQTICSLRTTTLGSDAPGANASPFTSVPLISPVRAIPALPPRQPLDCCGLPGRSDRGRVVRPGGGPPLIAGRAAAHPHQQRAQCHGPPRPRFGQLTRLCRCVPEPLPLSPGLPHPFSRCWIRVPAAPIACLTDRGACACQQ